MKVHMYTKLSFWFTFLVILDSIIWIDIYIIFLLHASLFIGDPVFDTISKPDQHTQSQLITNVISQFLYYICFRLTIQFLRKRFGYNQIYFVSKIQLQEYWGNIKIILIIVKSTNYNGVSVYRSNITQVSYVYISIMSSIELLRSDGHYFSLTSI